MLRRLAQSFHIPAEVVLFTPDGVFVDPEDTESLSPGEFLALIAREKAEGVLSRPGITGTKLPLGPNGWSRWVAYRLDLKAEALLYPYCFGEDSAPAGWRLEDPVELPVTLASHVPVYIGQWPRLQLDRPGDFEDAVIELTQTGGPARVFRVGSAGISVRTDSENAWLDLGAIPELRQVFGPVRLVCRKSRFPDAPALGVSFICCPPLQLAYVADPRDRPVRAVEVALPVYSCSWRGDGCYSGQRRRRPVAPNAA